MITNTFEWLYTEYEDGNTVFHLDACELDKWMHQNKGEIIDAFDGCLLDNYLTQTKNGFAVILEQYVNANMSEYKIIFSRNLEDVEDIFTDAYYKAERMA